MRSLAIVLILFLAAILLGDLIGYSMAKWRHPTLVATYGGYIRNQDR